MACDLGSAISHSEQSVVIAGGQSEGILDNPDLRLVMKDDLHDVEAKLDVRHIEHSQPLHRSLHDTAAFFSIHGGGRAAEGFRRPGFHLDEDERLAVAADEINLAAPMTPEVAGEDFAPAVDEQVGRQIFSESATGQMRGGRALRAEEASAKPGQKCGDEVGTGHGCPA